MKTNPLKFAFSNQIIPTISFSFDFFRLSMTMGDENSTVLSFVESLNSIPGSHETISVDMNGLQCPSFTRVSLTKIFHFQDFFTYNCFIGKWTYYEFVFTLDWGNSWMFDCSSRSLWKSELLVRSSSKRWNKSYLSAFFQPKWPHFYLHYWLFRGQSFLNANVLSWTKYQLLLLLTITGKFLSVLWGLSRN